MRNGSRFVSIGRAAKSSGCGITAARDFRDIRIENEQVELARPGLSKSPTRPSVYKVELPTPTTTSRPRCMKRHGSAPVFKTSRTASLPSARMPDLVRASRLIEPVMDACINAPTGRTSILACNGRSGLSMISMPDRPSLFS